jgi:hypothetical protein
MGRAADACRMTFWEKEIITAAAKVHATAGNGMLHCGTQASSSVGPNFERLKFQGAGRRLICLKCIYNFLCSMLVYTPFALCFVTLCGVFMHFLELTY